MCGIIACRTRGAADAYLLPALASLEYRGYDSAGVAIRTGQGNTLRVRTVDRVEDLSARLRALHAQDLHTLEVTGDGIGHTRWATHGGVIEENAHPHLDCSGVLSVVHNGIITNAAALRASLEQEGHSGFAEVDSAVIAHLIEREFVAGTSLGEALRRAAGRLAGTWAIVVMDARTGAIAGTAHRAPLIVASASTGRFFASDVSAIERWIDSFQVLREGDVVELGETTTWLGTDTDGASAEPAQIAHHLSAVDRRLHGHEDYMSKEIDEQPEIAAGILDRVAPAAVDGRLWRATGLPAFGRVAILACGTSLNAGGIIAAALRRFGSVPVACLVASEAADAVLEADTLVIAISQSGETADILHALDSPVFTGLPLLALTNNAHSSLARLADAVVDCTAGHEVGVAATKTFVAQVLTGVAVAVSALRAQDLLAPHRATAIIDDLKRMPDLLAQSLAVSKIVVPELVGGLVDAPGFLYLGRGAGVIYAAEGALKLKELTYRWAEAYPAGELKHGPLALVENGTPVIVVDNGDPRLESNIAEVSARGAHVIRIGASGSTIPALGRSVDEPVREGFQPCGPLESVIPLQLLARELAVALGRDVDKPRNLAKSVTVE
jgi:glutamine---fructose-6-phosphate transaminase (isomerizing)